MPRILHLLDPTTPTDSLDILAHLLAHAPDRHFFAGLGHRSTGILAVITGIPPGAITWLPSMGWADPTGWRALRGLIKRINPTHLHAWGVPAAVAAGMCKFSGPRLATFAELPLPFHMKILFRLDRRGSFTWIATSTALCHHLIEHGLNAGRVQVIRPGIAPVDLSDEAIAASKAMLRRQLGIAADEGPILLVGGEGKNARYDYGIWTAAIIQQILPKTRIILRQNPRTAATPGLDRFFNLLPDENLVAVAPRHLSWRTLMPAADIFLIAAEATIPTGSILEAMAAGVPIIATPIDAVKELIEHQRNGILSNTLKPRPLAAQLQEFLIAPALRGPLTSRAKADIHANFTVEAMVNAYAALIQ